MKQQRQSRVDISLNMVRCWSINNTANILFNKHSSRMIYCNTFPPEDAWMLIFGEKLNGSLYHAFTLMRTVRVHLTVIRNGWRSA